MSAVACWAFSKSHEFNTYELELLSASPSIWHNINCKKQLTPISCAQYSYLLIDEYIESTVSSPLLLPYRLGVSPKQTTKNGHVVTSQKSIAVMSMCVVLSSYLNQDNLISNLELFMLMTFGLRDEGNSLPGYINTPNPWASHFFTRS